MRTCRHGVYVKWFKCDKCESDKTPEQWAKEIIGKALRKDDSNETKDK